MSTFNFAPLRKSIEDIATRRRELRLRIEQAQSERDAIARAPVSRDDVHGVFAMVIEQRSLEYLQTLQAQVDVVMRKPQRFQDPRQAVNALAVAAIARRPGDPVTPQSIDTALCFLFKQQLVHAVGEAIKRIDWPADAISLADKTTKLAELDERINGLIEAENELLSAARASGLILE